MWIDFVNTIKMSSKIFLTMAMAAIGLSTNLKDLNKMGYKPFIVGFVSLLTVGFVSLVTINYLSEILLKSAVLMLCFLRIDCLDSKRNANFWRWVSIMPPIFCARWCSRLMLVPTERLGSLFTKKFKIGGMASLAALLFCIDLPTHSFA